MIDQQISNRSIDDAIKYSNVSFTFYQSNIIRREIMVNDDPSYYKLPFSKRFLLALGGGWEVFTEVVLMITRLWMIIITGFAVWAVVRYLRRINRKRLSLPFNS
jgi:hypothetical protein